MRFSKLLSGLVIAFSLYFFLLNQERLLGGVFVVADETQRAILLTLIVAYSALASLDRLSQFRLVLIPLLLIISLDIAFNSLLSLGYPQYFVVYQSMRWYIAIFSGSLAFSYIKLTDKPIHQTLISATSLVVAGLSSYYLFSYLSQVFGLPSLAIPSLALFLILAITAISTAFEGEVFQWIRSERSFLMLILFLLTFYSILIKPMLSDRPGIADFIEWSIVALTFIKVSRDFRRGVEADEREFIASHVPKEKIFRDRLYSELEFGERAFVEGGSKIPLTIALVKALSNSDPPKLAAILSPLISHEDERIPALPFPWEKEIIERRNRRRREKIVEMIRTEVEREVKNFNR
ncbi:MAG: hypothetical protein H0Z19_00635 [Archaeoglobus sp.]|uniref:hypothetical protein n=1 Tax=Archaeoglobus sp. TaxID=1872626 RepID=UPI001DEADA86|nr:hypothetical protein [Archaeoglobus sp.]MBO8178980.1 hypothetical protein [Archaeoglobus sp.]